MLSFDHQWSSTCGDSDMSEHPAYDYDIKGRCELPERLEMLVAVDLRRANDDTWKRLIKTISPEARLPNLPLRRRSATFMAGSVPADFVPRPEEYEQVIARLLAEPRGAVAITAAPSGAGGYGKTTLAKAICHDERIRKSFADGVLWVTLGQTPGDLTRCVEDLIYRLSGKRPGFAGVEAATAELAEILGERDLLLRIWESNTGTCLSILHVDGELRACSCSSDAEYIVAAGERGLYMLRLVR
jgi:hypothetical protein